MSFKLLWYGTNEPSLARVILTPIGWLLLMGAASIGIFRVDFVPNDEWLSLGTKLSIGIAAVLTVLACWGRLTGRIESPKMKPAAIAGGLAALPLVLFGFLWLNLVYAIPNFAAAAIGNEESFIESIDVRRNTARRKHPFCDLEISAPTLENALFAEVCVEWAVLQTSDTPVTVRLTVKRLPAGFRITAIEKVGEPES